MAGTQIGQAQGGGTARALRRGDLVLAALAVFTAVEFTAAMTMEGVPLLTALSVFALIKAALILNYFMHFRQLWEHAALVWNSFWLDPSGDEDED